MSIATVLLIIVAAKLAGEEYDKINEYTWNAVLRSKGPNLLIRGAKVDMIKNDINKLIYALNGSEKDPESFRTPEGKDPTDPPKLKLRNIKGRVVTVEVINDEYLTQRMGTAGADSFMAEATFTLTEYDNIKFVNFIFEAGDHAAPGRYSRDHFLKTWKIAK